MSDSESRRLAREVAHRIIFGTAADDMKTCGVDCDGVCDRLTSHIAAERRVVEELRREVERHAAEREEVMGRVALAAAEIDDEAERIEADYKLQVAEARAERDALQARLGEVERALAVRTAERDEWKKAVQRDRSQEGAKR